MLWWIYGLLSLWQVYWFVSAVRRKQGWGRLLVLCAVSLLLAVGCTVYYNVLPGFGIMPGWAYFQESFYSLIMSVVFALTTLLALLGKLLRK